MPLTIGRSRRSSFAKTVVKIPRKQVAGQPGLEPVDAPLTPLEKKVARIFVEALTFTPRQISKLLEEDETAGALTPFLEHLEPARKELSDALMEQLDESGAFFWNELVDQLKRKPDPSSVNFIAKNQIRKEIDPEDVTVVMPTGAEFTSSFSKRTPRGKRWADNESARLITNIAEETRENLQDVIASATGRGGRQRMMTLLGNVLENAPAGVDSGNVLTKFQSEVSPAVAGLTFKQHNAVINTANKAFDDALAKGLSFNKAVEAAEKEALAHGKRAREYRARMISRTEMMEASNRGKLEAAQQAAEAGMFNPHRAGRQWVTSTFDVCVTCEPLHGKVVAFESGTFPAKYKVSGNWVEEPHDLPPAHPNCRCTWTLVYDTVVPPTATETGVLTPPKDVPLELLNRAWAEAGKLARSVASVQDEVTGVMVSVADDIGADMYGLQHATKTEASLARKITTDFTDEVAKDPTLTVEAVAEDIGDALRFTMIADAETYTDDVMAALRDLEARGYTYKKAPKNFWRVDNLKNPYNGINVNMRTPTGQIVEIQFHTPDGIAMKNRIHPLYEKQRAIGVTQELKDEIAEEMAEMVSVLDYPDNVTDLRFFPDEEIKYRLETEDDIVARFGGNWPEGTMDAYTDADGNWWEMRETLHENIIEEGLSKATPVEEPIVHFMGGGPASGKGTAIRQGLIDVPDNIVVVDADEIKDALPEYKALIDDRSSRAAAYVHEESSYLSKEMFQESIDSGRNTQLDGTGDSSLEKLRSKVASAREASSAKGGTKVIADYITIDTEEAVRRARRRAIQTGRSVPEEVVRQTHASISKIFPDILDENLFDDIKLWDTAFDPPKLILRKVDGVLEIYDEAAYERFLLKNPDYQGAGIQAGVEPIIDSKSRVYLTIDEQYDPLRQKQVHEPFYEEKLAQGVPTDEPDVVFLGGGPASGKSSIIDTGDVELPEGHVLVNADDAKEAIPEYNVIIENGDDWASTYTHEESSDMAKELMARSIRDESMPTVLDGTGDSSFASLSRKVETAREQAKGGRIIGEYVTVDTDVALQRTVDRYKRTGRKVPKEVVEGTHESVSRVFPQAAEADLFDELRLWDTNSGKPVLIYEKVDGVEDIIDQELYERFLRKNPDYVPPAPVKVAPVDTPVASVQGAGVKFVNKLEKLTEEGGSIRTVDVNDALFVETLGRVGDFPENISPLQARPVLNPQQGNSRVFVNLQEFGDIDERVVSVNARLYDTRTVQGFDELPTPSSQAQLDELIEEGGLELWRGDDISDFAQQLQKNGDFYYTGEGIYGDGTYFAPVNRGIRRKDAFTPAGARKRGISIWEEDELAEAIARGDVTLETALDAPDPRQLPNQHRQARNYAEASTSSATNDPAFLPDPTVTRMVLKPDAKIADLENIKAVTEEMNDTSSILFQAQQDFLKSVENVSIEEFNTQLDIFETKVKTLEARLLARKKRIDALTDAETKELAETVGMSAEKNWPNQDMLDEAGERSRNRRIAAGEHFDDSGSSVPDIGNRYTDSPPWADTTFEQRLGDETGGSWVLNEYNLDNELLQEEIMITLREGLGDMRLADSGDLRYVDLDLLDDEINDQVLERIRFWLEEEGDVFDKPIDVIADDIYAYYRGLISRDQDRKVVAIRHLQDELGADIAADPTGAIDKTKEAIVKAREAELSDEIVKLAGEEFADATQNWYLDDFYEDPGEVATMLGFDAHEVSLGNYGANSLSNEMLDTYIVVNNRGALASSEPIKLEDFIDAQSSRFSWDAREKFFEQVFGA